MFYNIISIMLFTADFGGYFIFRLNYQMHIFHATAVFRAGGNDINSCCVDTAVTKNVGKFRNVFFNAVKRACKQMAKIMRKYFLRIDICIFTQGFHFSPNIRAVYGFAAFRYKNQTAFYSLLCCIAEQFLFQFFHDENRACFCLAVYDCLAAFYRLNRDVLQLADTDTCGTYRLND